MVIGICDDNDNDISIIETMCKRYLGDSYETFF